MKVFKFKFSALLYFLISLVAIIGFGGLALNLVRFFSKLNNAYHTVKPLILSAISLSLLAVSVIILFFSGYKIDGGMLTFFVGFVKVKYNVLDIVLVKEFKTYKKLALYFKDANFTAIIIDQKLFDAFVKKLRQFNNSFSHEVVGE